MLNNDQAISMFNADILPAIMLEEQQRPNPKPDWPARQQAWNNFIDSLAKSGEIPESVGYDLEWRKPDTITKWFWVCRGSITKMTPRDIMRDSIRVYGMLKKMDGSILEPPPLNSESITGPWIETDERSSGSTWQ